MTTETSTHERILGAVNKFYEQFPFPGFDLGKYKTKSDLDKQASWWAHKLDAELPFDCDIADIGCGTGQLANFLGLKAERRIPLWNGAIECRLYAYRIVSGKHEA